MDEYHVLFLELFDKQLRKKYSSDVYGQEYLYSRFFYELIRIKKFIVLV